MHSTNLFTIADASYRDELRAKMLGDAIPAESFAAGANEIRGFLNHNMQTETSNGMGNDHMDVHGSMEGYRDSLKDFFKCKTVFLNDNQIYKDEFEDVAEHMVECSPSDYDLKPHIQCDWCVAAGNC